MKPDIIGYFNKLDNENEKLNELNIKLNNMTDQSKMEENEYFFIKFISKILIFLL